MDSPAADRPLLAEELGITPEMVSAGERILASYSNLFHSDREWAVAVYWAMERARTGRADLAPDIPPPTDPEWRRIFQATT